MREKIVVENLVLTVPLRIRHVVDNASPVTELVFIYYFVQGGRF